VNAVFPWPRPKPCIIHLIGGTFRYASREYWSDFIPFLDYDLEIGRAICSTNAIKSLNACYRRAAVKCPQAPKFE